MNVRAISRSLNLLLKHQLIDIVDYHVKSRSAPVGEDLQAYFLTNKGIKLVREYMDLPVNYYHKKKKVIKKGYFTAAELKIHPKNINHQIHLNEFVLQFYERNPSIECTYYDEKFASVFNHIRPDGLLVIENTYFFLEMDMATESKKQLLDKWEHYRNFMISNEFMELFDKHIVVLFICEGTNNVELRKKVVNKTLIESLPDMINHLFSFYSDNSIDLLDKLDKTILPHILNKKKEISNTDISHYLHLHSLNHNFVKRFRFDYIALRQFNNLTCTLVIDDNRDKNVTTILKTQYYHQISQEFQAIFSMPFIYVMLVDNFQSIFDFFNLTDTSFKNIYFTTINMLERYPKERAFVTLDTLGNVYQVDFTNLDKIEYLETLDI